MRWFCFIIVCMFGSHVWADWVYDPSDTFIKFYVHLKELPKLANTGYHQHFHASGTRVGSYIITNAHAVCLPGQKMSTVWLSFPARYSYLDHFDADLDVGIRVAKLSEAIEVGSKTFQNIDPLFDALEKNAIAYRVHLPDGTECDGDSDHDLAILERIDDQHTFEFPWQTVVRELDCRLPPAQRVSWMLGGGSRIDQANKTEKINYRTSMGTFVVRNPVFNHGTFFGMLSPMYQGVQLNMPKQHAFLTNYVRPLAVGDSGSGMIQTPCKDDKNVSNCMSKVFQDRFISAENVCRIYGLTTCGLQDFLAVNGYGSILSPTGSMFEMSFWGIAQGNGKLTATSTETSDFAVSFAQNKAFLQKHLPASYLHPSCKQE